MFNRETPDAIDEAISSATRKGPITVRSQTSQSAVRSSDGRSR